MAGLFKLMAKLHKSFDSAILRVKVIKFEYHMNIYLKKFGTLLISRSSGKEALLAFRPVLRSVKDEEKLIIDFEGVSCLAPGWADEFLTPLFNEYGSRIVLRNTKNSSVKMTLDFLDKIKRGVDLFPKKA